MDAANPQLGNNDQARLDRAHEVQVRANPAARLSLGQFRALVGIPQRKKPGSISPTDDALDIEPPTISTAPVTRPRVLILFRLLSPPPRPGSDEEAEWPTSLYYALVREESDQWRLYHIYNVITYTCLVLQLVIAAALIIIGAIPGRSGSSGSDFGNRLAIAILGAATGILTGVMSLLKGQGLPIRFLKFASRLRQVREKIIEKERALRASVSDANVTYQDVVSLFSDYEDVISERDMNRPDAWASSTGEGDFGRR